MKSILIFLISIILMSIMVLVSNAKAEDLLLSNPITDGYHIADDGGNITISDDSIIEDDSFVICVAEGTTTISTGFKVETGGVFGVFTGSPSEIPKTWDYDTDEMPDWWEFTYFLSIDEDPLGDYDNDGGSNIIEYTYETDPTDSSNSPHLYNYDYDGSGRIYNIQKESE